MQVWNEFDQGINDSSVKQMAFGVSVRVLQQMGNSLNIIYEWNIIRTI